MPLKKSQMYDWVTHTHDHLGWFLLGNLSFGQHEKCMGVLRLIEKEFSVKYGEGKTIFMENCNDMFAADVPHHFITAILEHCKLYPRNIYVFQTKNPIRYSAYLKNLPPYSILGTTIETNRRIDNIGTAPTPDERALAMHRIEGFPKFVTIEPILDFDIDTFVPLICLTNPSFVNIGADSKGHGLQEPCMDKVMEFVGQLKAYGVTVRKKSNLERLKK